MTTFIINSASEMYTEIHNSYMINSIISFPGVELLDIESGFFTIQAQPYAAGYVRHLWELDMIEVEEEKKEV